MINEYTYVRENIISQRSEIGIEFLSSLGVQNMCR